jgi:hypothetical protein
MDPLTTHLLIMIQDSAFGTWIRESDWAIFAFLIIHTISMGFLIGTAFAIHLRVLGAANSLSPALLTRFLPVMRIAIVVAICSGILLVTGYPAKALTNPLFYVKLIVLVVAILLTFSLARRLPAAIDTRLPATMKILAFVGMVLWTAGLTAGKFLAYTNKVLLLY